MCSSDPPAPDPMIGQAAAANADISKEMAVVARDQLQWNKDRAAVSDPLTKKIAEQQIATSDVNTARSQDQWDSYQNLFKPVEKRMVDDANNWDSDARKEQMASEAGADVTRSYQGTKASSQRQLESMGVNPNSGRFAALNAESDLAQAKDSAGAMNAARRATEQQGIALRTGVSQFGRNMPSTGIAADTVALNAGTAAGSTMAQSAAVNNAASNTAANWFGGASSASSAAGQTGLGLYNAQLGAWSQDQKMKSESMAGIGQAAGMAGGAAMMFMRRGGLIGKPRSFRMHRLNTRGGLQSLRRGYTEGGMVDPSAPQPGGGMVSGPGTSTSDSVPAMVDGEQPARLSTGEAVLNAEAVELVGEDFIHRINAGGLAMSKGRGEGMEPRAEEMEEQTS